MDGQLTRRDALRLGATAVGVAALGGLAACGGRNAGLGAAAPSAVPATTPLATLSSAPTPSAAQIAVPAVDRLAVWAVVDNAYNALVKGAPVGNVDVQRIGMGAGPMLSRQLQSEFGLALHLESRLGGQTRNYLLDFGLSPGVELNNIDVLKIDPSLVDALILSHGHYDHFGGLVPLLDRLRKRMRKDLPFYVGGEDAFCRRYMEPPGGQRMDFGVLDRHDLAKAGVRVIQAEKPTVIAGQAFTTGAVPLTSFETILPAPKVELGMRDGVGCDQAHFSPEEVDGAIVPDLFRAEHATCFNVKDRGLVVISSCGHAGIVNAVKAAQAVSGVSKVHAVMGGFHLTPAMPPYVAQVVDALKALDPDYLIPMHCSGQLFAQKAEEAMPGRVITNYTGTRYIFGT